VDIEIFDINEEHVVQAILDQAKKVKVRMIVDRRMSKGRSSAVPALIAAGVEIRFGKQKGIMHNKLTIVDGRMIELGSFNCSHGAANSNQENQLYLGSQEIVNKYVDGYELIWSRSSSD
jgi:phosphatidylserine/phosphatidylglycerophosphate/cardiolipin synthase-like enzyme